MQGEQWKPVVGYEGQYEVSTWGRVCRLVKRRSSRAGALLRQHETGNGYRQIALNCRATSVHRLILEAFVGPCPSGLECNHKNGVKTDNYLENLEWVTKSENKLHAFRELGLQAPRGEDVPTAKLEEAEVRLIKQSRLRRMTARWLAGWFHVSRGTITKIWRGESWKHISP